jgi:catechol 2,3-dioxygenase-like lactoylglutathione lyase family enzyme
MRKETLSEAPGRQIVWRGFHHVAVVTQDLDETVRFYRDLLGMQAGEVVDRTAQGAVSRHCFIKPGEAETWGLHFFEAPDAEPHGAAGKLDDESLLGTVGMQHVAFALPDEAEGLALRERLRDAGVETTDVGNIGSIRNTLFFDNNGLLLEATWPKP